MGLGGLLEPFFKKLTILKFFLLLAKGQVIQLNRATKRTFFWGFASLRNIHFFGFFINKNDLFRGHIDLLSHKFF